MAKSVMDIPLGWPLPKRIQHLSNLNNSVKGKYSYPLKFQGSPHHFNVFTIDIELPKYRLANGRTQAAQEKYLANHSELDPHFFDRDTESIEAQRIQHTLLKELVEGTSLYAYFKDPSNTQDQPLILTNDGYVVNGNRRLCAMRELYCGTPEKYNYFKHIDVVILPVCTLQDIDELEAYLQIQPDIKEDYTWISKACMLRARQQQHNYTNTQLAEIYQIPEREIKTMLDELALADKYLLSRGADRQYDVVEKKKYFFGPLLKTRQQIKQPEKKDLQTEISFILIDQEEDVKGRLYEWIPDIKENLDKIATQLQETIVTNEKKPAPKSNQYSIFGEEEDTSIDISSLIEAMNEEENKPLVIDVVKDIIESQKQLQEQKTKANSVLRAVSNANANLKTALNYITSSSSKQGVKEQLDGIEEAVAQLRKWLQ